MNKLHELTLKKRPLVEKYLRVNKHNFSVYSFANIYLWKSLYEVFYSLIDKNLCIFFKDKHSCFMNIAPLGRNISSKTLDSCFDIMNRFNKNKELSRIENVDKTILLQKDPKDIIKEKFSEYLYLRKNLSDLKGNKFKSKRASLNYFLKNYNYEFSTFKKEYTEEAISLYKNWSQNRKSKLYKDDTYCMMIEDNLIIHEFLMKNFTELRMNGFVVKINGRIKAYTFGYPVNNDMFCIFAEITDLSIKGLAQFIFWQFCKILSGYKFINTMDDSGLDNLKRVKLSYHPLTLTKNFILKRDVR